MKNKTSKARRVTTLAALALSAGATVFGTLVAKAESWHTITDACVVSVFGSVNATCPFTMQGNVNNPPQYNAYASYIGGGAANGNVNGWLTPSWNVINSGGMIANFSPEMNFRRVCSTAMSNWNNSVTYPTGWQVMYGGYVGGNQGGAISTFTCPSARPYMQAVNVDTQVKW